MVIVVTCGSILWRNKSFGGYYTYFEICWNLYAIYPPRYILKLFFLACLIFDLVMILLLIHRAFISWVPVSSMASMASMGGSQSKVVFFSSRWAFHWIGGWEIDPGTPGEWNGVKTHGNNHMVSGEDFPVSPIPWLVWILGYIGLVLNLFLWWAHMRHGE